jgi:flagellar biosynthesis regulator FlbT
LGNLARNLSEQEDERMWSTLPDKIWISGVVLLAGRRDIEIDFFNGPGAAMESPVLQNLQISDGGRQFVIVRTVK